MNEKEQFEKIDYPIDQLSKNKILNWFEDWIVEREISSIYECVSPRHKERICQKMEIANRIRMKEISSCLHYSLKEKEEKIMELQDSYFDEVSKIKRNNTYWNYLYALNGFISYALPLKNHRDFVEKMNRYIGENSNCQLSWTEKVRSAIILFVSFLKWNNRNTFIDLELPKKPRENFLTRGKRPCVKIEDFQRVIPLLRNDADDFECKDEFKKFKKYSVSLAIHIAFKYGFRVSEVLSLKNNQLLGNEFYITISKTAEQSLKPVFDDIREAVKKFLAIKKSTKRLNENKDDLLFVNTFGNPLTYSVLIQWIEKCIPEEKDKSLFNNMHANRRGCITFLAENGVDYATIGAFVNKDPKGVREYVEAETTKNQFKSVSNSFIELQCKP